MHPRPPRHRNPGGGCHSRYWTPVGQPRMPPPTPGPRRQPTWTPGQRHPTSTPGGCRHSTARRPTGGRAQTHQAPPAPATGLPRRCAARGQHHPPPPTKPRATRPAFAKTPRGPLFQSVDCADTNGYHEQGTQQSRSTQDDKNKRQEQPREGKEKTKKTSMYGQSVTVARVNSTNKGCDKKTYNNSETQSASSSSPPEQISSPTPSHAHPFMQALIEEHSPTYSLVRLLPEMRTRLPGGSTASRMVPCPGDAECAPVRRGRGPWATWPPLPPRPPPPLPPPLPPPPLRTAAPAEKAATPAAPDAPLPVG